MLSTKCVDKSYVNLIYIYKQNLALNNPQCLICHKTIPNQTTMNSAVTVAPRGFSGHLEVTFKPRLQIYLRVIQRYRRYLRLRQRKRKKKCVCRKLNKSIFEETDTRMKRLGKKKWNREKVEGGIERERDVSASCQWKDLLPVPTGCPTPTWPRPWVSVFLLPKLFCYCLFVFDVTHSSFDRD